MTRHPSSDAIFPFTRHRLVFDMGDYPDVKDPDVVHDGTQWHLFGTGCNARNEGGPLEILHAVAPRLTGPWKQRLPSRLDRDLGCEAAAPGVVVDRDGVMHMFVQTLWSTLGGTIEHFVSGDDGDHFRWHDTAMSSVPDSGEAGIYDPQPCEVRGVRYLVYSGMTVAGRPDVFLARSESGTWAGPWRREGCILSHQEIGCHNQLDDPDYEWGLEGGQILELPDGKILLNAVCFLGDAPPRTRQRVFFALADDVNGPYDVLGSALDPVEGRTAGENGHGVALVHRGRLQLVFQERVAPDWHWRYAVASAPAMPARYWMQQTG